MVKHSLILLLLLFSIISCLENKTPYVEYESMMPEEKLFGNVKNIKNFKANYLDHDYKELEKPIIISEQSYSNFGALIEDKIFENKGELIYATKHFYNEEQNLTKTIAEDFKTSLKVNAELRYNDKYEMVSSKNIYSDGDEQTDQYEYNGSGNLISQISIYNKDTTIVKYEYFYNKKGKVIKVLKIEFGEFKPYKSKTINKYNDQGAIIETTFSSETMKDNTTRFSYYEDGSIKTISELDDYRLTKSTEYNSKNLPVLTQYYTDKGIRNELKSSYEYDKQGNWIKKKVSLKQHFNDDKEFLPFYEETRKIEYYEIK